MWHRVHWWHLFCYRSIDEGCFALQYTAAFHSHRSGSIGQVVFHPSQQGLQAILVMFQNWMCHSPAICPDLHPTSRDHPSSAQVEATYPVECHPSLRDTQGSLVSHCTSTM